MKKIFLLSALFMVLVFSAKVNAAANWIWVYSDDYRTIWIDNNSIGRDSNGFFAYFAWTYSDAGRNQIIESRRSFGLSVSGFYNLSHTVWFLYFKNSSGIKYCSWMNSVDYDKSGNIIDSSSKNNFDWQRIIPDTHADTMYDAAYARIWR